MESLLPLEWPTLKMLTDDGWRGDITNGVGDYETDGHTMFPKRYGLERSDDEYRPLTQSCEECWKKHTTDAVTELLPVGIQEVYNYLILVDQSGQRYGVDAARFYFIQRLTKFDKIRTRGGDSAIVFYKDGAEVAILMPMRSAAVNA
jgi:hypothetical protein